MPRLAGLVAAGLLATSAAHVVVTSHVARAESFTPLLVICLLFAVERALNGRTAAGCCWRAPSSAWRSRPRRWSCSDPAGLLLAVWWRGRSLLLSHWSAVAVLGFAATYAGMLTATVREARSGRGDGRVVAGGRRGPEPDRRDVPGLGRRGAGGVWRILAASSPVGCRPRTCCRIRWPGRSCCWRCWACWCWCCAAVLLPLVALSCLAIVPYAQRRGGPAPERALADAGRGGRHRGDRCGGRGAGADRGRPWEPPRLALGVMLGGLVLAPLGGLRTYYDEATADERTADGLLRVPRAVFDERRYDEVVLLDGGSRTCDSVRAAAPSKRSATC